MMYKGIKLNKAEYNDLVSYAAAVIIRKKYYSGRTVTAGEIADAILSHSEGASDHDVTSIVYDELVKFTRTLDKGSYIRN